MDKVTNKYLIKNVPIREIVKGEVFLKSYSNSAEIDQESTWNVPITDSDVQQFTYFNRLIFHNTSSVDVEVRFNGSTTQKRRVLAGTTEIFGKTDNREFWLLTIYNTSTVTKIEINELHAEVSKVNE
jgi:hypothetical protein